MSEPESPPPSIFVWIPLTPEAPRYNSVGGGMPTGLRILILLSREEEEAACIGLMGEQPTATEEDMDGESWDEEGDAFVECSRAGGAVIMCGEEERRVEVLGGAAAAEEEVMAEEE